MGHQVNFYASPADIDLLEQAMRRKARLVVIHDQSASPRPRVIDSMNVDENGRPWLFFHLVRPEDIGQIVMHHVPAQGYWTVDVIQSPVVEFTRSFFDQRILRRGRAYYVSGFYGPDGTWIEKSEEFRTWAKSLLTTIKKNLGRYGSNYIGPDALSWLKSCGGKLVE